MKRPKAVYFGLPGAVDRGSRQQTTTVDGHESSPVTPKLAEAFLGRPLTAQILDRESHL
jgi:hypothetical protein